jgi:hypothetical protein
MHARLDRGAVRLLTGTGLDWTYKYPTIAAAVASIDAWQAYLDGELCGVGPDGITSFGMIQAASDSSNAGALIFFLFDLLHLDGENLFCGGKRAVGWAQSQVRSRLPAGGNRVQTVGSDEGTRRPRGFGCRSRRVFRWRGIERRRREPSSNLAVSRGTDGSNPASSSRESANHRFLRAG